MLLRPHLSTQQLLLPLRPGFAISGAPEFGKFLFFRVCFFFIPLSIHLRALSLTPFLTDMPANLNYISPPHSGLSHIRPPPLPLTNRPTASMFGWKTPNSSLVR